ncbi:MAG: M48 family metallopeptidase [Clostridia bacterium]|nr:M48 family metallopeptidase [Clostridia bacterium]
MNCRTLFLILIALDLAYDVILRILAASRRGLPLPEAVRDLYDADDYARWLDYSAEKRRLGLIEKVFDALILTALFASNIFAAVRNRLPGGEGAKDMLLILLFVTFTSVLSLPFDWIREMRIEAKYGFSRTSKGIFVRDEITGFLVNAGLTCLLCLFLSKVWERFGARGFFVLFAGLSVFVVVFSMLSTFFMRLYNKFTPLEEGTLRETLTELFSRAGYRLENIYVMDASRRTTKVNAFCSGLGKFKKIVLYDNLVNGYSEDEIAAVFAHELGHYKRRDTMKNTIYTVLLMAVVTAAAAWFALNPGISAEYGFSAMNPAFGVILLESVVLNPIITVLTIPRAAMARRFEYRADGEAVESGYGEALVSALKKLSRDNFSDLNPHPLIVTLEYDHPTTADRIGAIRRRDAERERDA